MTHSNGTGIAVARGAAAFYLNTDSAYREVFRRADETINSGEDATLDSVISASTLVAAAIFLFPLIVRESDGD